MAANTVPAFKTLGAANARLRSRLSRVGYPPRRVERSRCWGTWLTLVRVLARPRATRVGHGASFRPRDGIRCRATDRGLTFDIQIRSHTWCITAHVAGV